jgi:hypothetical protein
LGGGREMAAIVTAVEHQKTALVLNIWLCIKNLGRA